MSQKTSTARKPKHFIKDVYLMELALFVKIAGQAGAAIYSECKFRMGMPTHKNGVVRLGNERFIKWNVSRQRKSEALIKLKNEGLLDYVTEAGKAPLVKLAEVIENDKNKKQK